MIIRAGRPALLFGPVAQLGERTVRIRKVVGSNPFRSTKKEETTVGCLFFFGFRRTFHSAAPCPHMKFANTDAPATVSNPATTIDRPLIAPSTSPSSMALAVPSACAAEPMLTPFAMGSVI